MEYVIRCGSAIFFGNLIVYFMYIINIMPGTRTSRDAYLYFVGPMFLVISGLVIIVGIVLSKRMSLEKKITSTPKIVGFEKVLFNYLKENQGRAFTVKALKGRIEGTVDIFQRKYCTEDNIKRILERLVSIKALQSNKHEGEPHYFFQGKK
ncbi:MAG: hypothetical protein JSV62_00880 [Promethearchaeota archaeon]|nr:MAG: hypothetical protein JSV62_00880 [Candidatus Lokiarchaeota archaeon]